MYSCSQGQVFFSCTKRHLYYLLAGSMWYMCSLVAGPGRAAGASYIHTLLPASHHHRLSSVLADARFSRTPKLFHFATIGLLVSKLRKDLMLLLSIGATTSAFIGLNTCNFTEWRSYRYCTDETLTCGAAPTPTLTLPIRHTFVALELTVVTRRTRP